MADTNLRSPRPRPVDVLFGEDVELLPKQTMPEPEARTPQTQGYLVEPPRPVTNLRPPPPEFPNEWRVVAPPEAATLIEPEVQVPVQPDPVAPPPKPVMVEPPVVEPIVEATTFTVRETPAPAPEPTPVLPPPVLAPVTMPAMVVAPAPPAPAPLYGQTELVELSQFVDQLYQNVADETSDSAALNAECLANLRTARGALEKGDYARAEAAAEQVKARLLRARASREGAAAQSTRLVMVWLGAAILIAVALFAIPFLFRIVPVVIPLLRGAAMGLLGGAVMGLWQMNQQIARREFDASFTRNYALSPIFGALLGAVLYGLSLLGILAAPNALGISAEPFLLMYLFALLAGLFNDTIIGALRGAVMGLRKKS